MKAKRPCKRGNIAERNKWGHCLCNDCKAYRYSTQYARRPEGYQLNWQRENKDKIKKYTEKWKAANKEKRKSVVESWRKRNPEKVKEMSNKAGRNWSKNNKGVRNAITAKRRATVLKQTPQWADLDMIRQFYINASNLTQATGIKHEVDHIIPLQGENVSGLHVHYNLQIITQSKNRSKRNKLEDSLCAFL